MSCRSRFRAFKHPRIDFTRNGSRGYRSIDQSIAVGPDAEHLDADPESERLAPWGPGHTGEMMAEEDVAKGA